ncbi:MAG TPA: hypothetical protein VFF16_07720 [Telluria sp.]|nr:hypothetical protein [Telluria sp.]
MQKEQLIEKLQQELRDVKQQRTAAKSDPALHAARTAVKQFQSDRLARTHADLLADENTRPAARFFLDELYSAHDLAQRDTDLERIIPTMQKVLPYEPLHAVTEAIVLDALSERLDSAMARALGERFDQARYLEAYRSVAQRAERERQLDLVETLGRSLSSLVRIPMLSATLAVMGGPARLAGLGDLHAFLQTGFATFKRMRQPERFVETILSRERAILANIYAGRPDSFNPAASA